MAARIFKLVSPPSSIVAQGQQPQITEIVGVSYPIVVGEVIPSGIGLDIIQSANAATAREAIEAIGKSDEFMLGTETVSRSLIDRLSDTVNIKDYGTTLAGFSAAIDAAIAGGKVLDLQGQTVPFGTAGLRKTITHGQILRIKNGIIDLSAVTTQMLLFTGWSSYIGLGIVGVDASGNVMSDANYDRATLTAEAAYGAETIAIDDCSKIRLGWNLLLSDIYWTNEYTTGAGDGGKMGQAIYVLAKSASSGAGTITLAQKIKNTYPVGATVRAYVDAEVKFDGVKLRGGGSTPANAQDGCWVHGIRRFTFNGVEVVQTKNRGIVAHECCFVESNTPLVAYECNAVGLGYGIVTSGSQFVHLYRIDATNTRHQHTGGRGVATRVITDTITIDAMICHGGMSASFDVHPGCRLLIIKNDISDGHYDASSDGDKFVYQGDSLIIENSVSRGSKRHHYTIQPWGHKTEGGLPFIKIGNAFTHQNDVSGTNYSIIFDDAGAGGAFEGLAPYGSIELHNCDFISRSGNLIKTAKNFINELKIFGGSCRSVGASNQGQALRVQGVGSYHTKHVAIFGTTFEGVSSSIDGLLIEGGTNQNTATLVGIKTIGARYGVVANNCSMKNYGQTASGYATAANIATNGGAITNV